MYPTGIKDVSIHVRALSSFGAIDGKLAADFTLWYRVGVTGASEPVELHDLDAGGDEHEDGGIFGLGDGWYRVDLPDDVFLYGGERVLIGGSVDGGTLISGWLDVDDLRLAGVVVSSDTAASTLDFATDLEETTEDAYVDVCCLFTSGDLRGEARFVDAYLAPADGQPSRLAVDGALSTIPAVGDKFVLTGKRG